MFNSQQQGFASKDSKAVTTYLTAFDAHLHHNYVYQPLSPLPKSDCPDHHLIETINCKIIWACQHPENTCRKHRLTYWTVYFHRTKLKLSVWCQIQLRLCCNLTITTIVKCAQHWDIIDPSGCTPEAVKETIDTLKKEIKAIHKTSHDKRQEYLLASANISEDTDDKHKAHILQQMMNAESRIKAYRRLGYARGKNAKQQTINRILVP